MRTHTHTTHIHTYTHTHTRARARLQVLSTETPEAQAEAKATLARKEVDLCIDMTGRCKPNSAEVWVEVEGVCVCEWVCMCMSECRSGLVG